MFFIFIDFSFVISFIAKFITIGKVTLVKLIVSIILIDNEFKDCVMLIEIELVFDVTIEVALTIHSQVPLSMVDVWQVEFKQVLLALIALMVHQQPHFPLNVIN